MHTHKRTLALLVPILALTGCANMTSGRAGLPDRWRTIVSANGATSPTETGPDNAKVAAELGVPEPRESASGRISGRVVDEKGRPVPSADVRLADGTARSGRDIRDVTDPAGGFTLKGLRPGESYTLIAERDNGQAFLVGRARAEAPDTAVRIRLLDPETAELQSQPPASSSRVGRVSSRETVQADDDQADDPFLDDEVESPPRSPRSSRSPRVNMADLPPAEEAETLDIPEPRTATRETKPIWRRVTATSDPDVAATTANDPPARTVEPIAADPVPASEPIPAVDPTPAVDLAPPVDQARPVVEEEEVNPLPPAKERPIEPIPTPAPARAPEPASAPAPTSTPEPAPSPAPEPDLPPPSLEPDPLASPPISEPEPPTRAIDPPPAEAVPAESMRNLDPAPEPVPQPQPDTVAPPSAAPPEVPPADSVAISAATAPRRKPTWGELTREASPPPSASPVASNIPISTRRLPVKVAATQEARGSRFFSLLGRNTPSGEPSEATPAIMASSVRYDSKTQRLIDFRLPDLDGNPVKLSEMDADYVLLDFWGTWCKPCKESIPKLVELQTVYGAKTLRVVGIASEEVGTSPQSQVASVDEVARTMGINYPLLMSGLDGKPCPLQEALHIQAFPTMILVDRTGKILWRGTGAETSTMIKLDRVIAARADSGIVRR